MEAKKVGSCKIGKVRCDPDSDIRIRPATSLTASKSDCKIRSMLNCHNPDSKFNLSN